MSEDAHSPILQAGSRVCVCGQLDSEHPGVDGTPVWAYDEDGYCVSCGNGRRKHHMPECELRDALDAVAIVRDFVDSGADDIDPRLGYVVVQVDREDWERAVEWVRDQEAKT